jgi:hypothetical protein
MTNPNSLKRLRLMYEQSLGRSPFPTEECFIAGITEKLHGELVVYLADIAGIASHGQKLKTISPERRLEFLKLSSPSFWDKFPSPEVQQKITSEHTPNLLRMMEDIEQARQLILACLK